MAKEYCDTKSVVVKQMVSRLDVGIISASTFKYLDPEAGNGVLIEHLPISKEDRHKLVDFCELNQKKASATHESTGATFRDWNFMDLSVDNTYDRIIAVPPFESLIWKDHTMKMYSHLKPNGKMVVLLPVESLQVQEFLAWIKRLCAKITFLNICACSYECDTYILEISK